MDNNKKQILLLIVAVVLGIAATALISFSVTRTIENQAQDLKEQYEAKQKKVIAAIQQEADQRAAILQQQIQAVKTEQAQVVQKQISELQVKLQQQQQNAATNAQPVKKSKPSLALKTPQGKRAVTVKIDSLAAVGGLLNPGDLVDVIARLRVPQGMIGKDGKRKQQTITAMVFQGLEVLAVNTNLDETGTKYEEQQNSPAIKVTLAVDPQEAGYLVFADKNGTLEFALRSPQETERQMVKTTTWKTLADYVLQNQGADIQLPDDLKGIVAKEDDKPAKPDIQIFRAGKEL